MFEKLQCPKSITCNLENAEENKEKLNFCSMEYYKINFVTQQQCLFSDHYIKTNKYDQLNWSFHSNIFSMSFLSFLTKSDSLTFSISSKEWEVKSFLFQILSHHHVMTHEQKPVLSFFQSIRHFSTYLV